jgi:hypothetical protein
MMAKKKVNVNARSKIGVMFRIDWNLQREGTPLSPG